MSESNNNQEMPFWAKAVIGILNALVTMVLALGVNVGEIVKTNTEASNRIQERTLDYDNAQKTQKALTDIIDKTVTNKEKPQTPPTIIIKRH